MENQHRKIKGYRELGQDEVDLMNRVKEQGEVMGALISELAELRNHHNSQAHEAIAKGVAPRFTFSQLGESTTAAGLAEDHLKTGVMWLVRAIALPASF